MKALAAVTAARQGGLFLSEAEAGLQADCGLERLNGRTQEERALHISQLKEDGIISTENGDGSVVVALREPGSHGPGKH